MSLLRLSFKGLLALAVTLTPAVALAQDADDTALAEALFQEGRRLFKAGSYDEACPKFDESHRLVPKLGTLLNLATCHDKQGKTGSAWGEYTQAVTLAKKAGEKDRVDYARAQLAELEPRLSKILIEVPDPVAGIEVLLDGKAIGEAAWRTPLPVDPGGHEVIAQAASHKSWKTSVTIDAKPTTTLVAVPKLEPGDDPAPVTPAPDGNDGADAVDDGGMSGLAIAGWVVGGVGVVGIGIGSYFGVNTFMKQGDSDDFCNGTLCNQEGVDLRDEARTSATISTVLFGVGLAAVAGGATMLIIDALSDDEPEETAGLTVHPIVGPGTYGAGMGVAW